MVPINVNIYFNPLKLSLFSEILFSATDIKRFHYSATRVMVNVTGMSHSQTFDIMEERLKSSKSYLK